MHKPFPLLPLLVIASSALLTGAIFISAYLWENFIALENRSNAFRLAAEDRVESIRREVQQNNGMVIALAGLFNASEQVTAEEYAAFTAPLLDRHPDIQALEWVPRVPAIERARFERTMGTEHPGFRVMELTAGGDVVPAEGRSVYFPVGRVQPLDGNRPAIGLDLASEPVRRSALLLARDAGRLHATGPVTLVQETGGQKGYRVYVPIYRRGPPLDTVVQRRTALKGFASGVLRIGDLVKQAVSVLDPRGVDLWVEDLAPGDSKTLAHFHRSPALRLDRAERPPPRQGELLLQERLDVGGRQWLVTVAPAPGFFVVGTPYLSWSVLGGGILTTLTLGFYLFNLRRRNLDLQRSEEGFRFLFEHMDQGVVYQDATGVITDANPAAQRILGLPLEQMVGRFATDPGWRMVRDDGSTLAGEDLPGMVAMRTGRPVSGVVIGVYNPALEGYRWLIVNAFLECMPGGDRSSLVVSTFEDITDVKTILERIRKERDRAQRYLDVTATILIALDRSGRIAMINRSGLEILGCDREQAIGADWFETFVTAEEREAVRSIFDRLLAGERSRDLLYNENAVLTPSGERRLIAWRNSVVPDDEGRVTQTLSSGTDVTVEREAKAQLVLSRRAVEATVNGILITDAGSTDNPITYVNPAFERITGFRAEEVVGSNPSFLQGDDREQPAVERIRLAVANEVSGVALLRNYRKDGSLFWNELHIAPVRDERGRVTHYVGVINDITEHKRYEEQLEYQSTHDPLTELPNRSLLHDRLGQAIAYAQRHEKVAAVLFIDLDRFKLINDGLGHPAGDAALRAIAKRLNGLVEPGDTVARYGGDEFVFVVSDAADSAAIERYGERVLRAFDEPVHCDGNELRMTASIGVSVAPRDGETPELLFRNADAAMYRAKDLGRSRIHFYTEALNRAATERLQIERGLCQALEGDQLRLHYQPQVDLRSGRIDGFEALVRWQHPTEGLVPPDRFLPVAVDSGLIVPIGEWVLRTACRQAAMWLAAGHEGIQVAVNVSARQFQDQDLPDLVRSVLGECGLPAGHLEVELTESELMADPEAAAEALRRLKATGIRLALDDFGTGYSSLSYLKRFAFDRVKLDKAFVDQVITDPNDAAITRAVIALGRSMGLEVVAEGVETVVQLAYLRREGCGHAQGFHFSRPIPEHEAGTMLRDCRRFEMAGEVASDSPPTILVVDTDRENHHAVAQALQADGIRVLAAGSIQEGFELLATHSVQVVLVEHRMPGMSGDEFLGRICSLYPEIIRLLQGGHGDSAVLTEVVERGGAWGMLAKPWDAEVLRLRVREAVAEYRRA